MQKGKNMFGELLKKYRKIADLTLEELAQRVNEIAGTTYTKATVRSWERGNNPKVVIIQIIADILDIPVQYLFDDSDKVINKIVANKAPQLKQMIKHTLRVPLYDGYVGAGSGGVFDAFEVKDYLYIDYFSIDKKYTDKSIVALTVVGDSMEPYVCDGDIVIFHPIVPSSNFPLIDGKYVIQTSNGLMVKNLTFKTNGNIVISSCNKSYASEEIDPSNQEQLEILGFVVGRFLKK